MSYTPHILDYTAEELGDVLTGARQMAGAKPFKKFLEQLTVMPRWANWPNGSTIWVQTGVTGSGATTRNEANNRLNTGATANSTSMVRSTGYGLYPPHVAGGSVTMAWSKRFAFSAIVGGWGTSTSTGLRRFGFGKTTSDTTIGDLARPGFQIKVEGSNPATVTFAAHNGTDLTTAAGSLSINATGWSQRVFLVVMDNGYAELYWDAAAWEGKVPSLVIPTGGPTSAITTSPAWFVDVANGANAADHRCDMHQCRAIAMRI